MSGGNGVPREQVLQQSSEFSGEAWVIELCVPMRKQLQQSSRERIIIGGNKSLGSIFSEKPADRTNSLKLEISSLTDFYDMLLRGKV